MKNMKYSIYEKPVHIDIIDKIPGYSQATPKRDKAKLKKSCMSMNMMMTI